MLRTKLDELHDLFVEIYGNADKLFNGYYGIQVVNPDTDENSRALLTPTNWGYFNRLLATGWQIDLIYARSNNQWEYDEFVTAIWIKQAIWVNTETILEIIQPLKPIGVNHHLTIENLWLLTFDSPLGGMKKILLESTAGLRVVGSQIPNNYARAGHECTYQVIVLTMEALQLPD